MSWLHIDIDVFRPSFSLFISSPPSVSPIRIIDYRSWLSSPTSCSIQLRLDCLHIIFLHYRTWPFLMLSSHNLSATATVGSYSWYICVWINTDIAHCTFPSEPITKELTEIKISKLHTHPLWSIFLTTVEPIGWRKELTEVWILSDVRTPFRVSLSLHIFFSPFCLTDQNQ